jgi:hypothetical protein
MAQLVSLDEYRERRNPLAAAMVRLDVAVVRLDQLVRRRAERLTPTIERELRHISRAVSDGLPWEAADRAERLAGILEHPLASG